MELTDAQLYDNKVSSIAILAIGILGMLVNLYVILALRRAKTFGYAFGRICMSHTVANFGNGFVFSCFVAPITLINPAFHKHYIGMRCGQLLILFWNASVLSHLLTALNRCVVMFFPLKSDRIFTERVTDVAIVALWTFSVCQVLPYFSPACLFDYHIETFTFLFSQSPCSVITGTYLDYYFSIAVICSIGLLDFVTFSKIRLMHKKTASLNVDMQVRRRKEVRFFFQAVCQGLFFMTELVSFFHISRQFENKWIRFGFTTMAWISIHTLDGLIVIVFNEEIRSFYTIRRDSTATRSTSESTIAYRETRRSVARADSSSTVV